MLEPFSATTGQALETLLTTAPIGDEELDDGKDELTHRSALHELSSQAQARSHSK